MHSNFITPPDFVDDEPLSTITVVNATLDELELLARMCEGSDVQYNIYLYRSEMNDTDWLRNAIKRSESVIVHTIDPELDWVCDSEKSYYYGDRVIITRAAQIKNSIHYFALKEQKS